MHSYNLCPIWKSLQNSQGWEKSGSGSLVAIESTRILLGSEFSRKVTHAKLEDANLTHETGLVEKDAILQYSLPDKPINRILSQELFSKITSRKVVNQLVLHLTSQGWVSDGEGGLRWDHEGFMESYVPPQLVELLSSTTDGAVESFLAGG